MELGEPALTHGRGNATRGITASRVSTSSVAMFPAAVADHPPTQWILGVPSLACYSRTNPH